jgi:hypothetical protein
MNIQSFLHRIYLPESHPRSLHPCLMNAIYLAACSLGGGYMSGFEPLFLSRTRSHLQQSLAYGDRLMHFMWASVILSCYYARAGRIIEAHNTISSTTVFAVGCGVHQNSVIVNGAPSAMSAPPADQIEAKDRIALWHAIFISDSVISSASGLPMTVPSDVCPFQLPPRIVSHSVFDDQNIASIHSLFPSTVCIPLIYPLSSVLIIFFVDSLIALPMVTT